ncbi:ESX secretion-associated protein EspG [Nocardia alni]|uniref:ESX secretion-associated protein EspG n=1 Tax=Nocardia alni TaxID=2815723 RepID=UPI001C223F0A|nr:ESX secretion-associated protein EspG [Nocardia alni]
MSTHLGRLTSFELVVLWELMSNDRLPFPLTHWPTHRYEDDYIRAKKETAERISRNPPLQPPQGWETADLLQLWKAAVNPDIVIWAAGEGAGDETDMQTVTRVVGLRREGFAVVLAQQPGETIDRGGDVDVYQTDVVGLAKAVIARLPKAGRGKDKEVPIFPPESDRVGYRYDSSPVRDPIGSPQQRSDRWRRAETTRVGKLKVEPGSGAHWIQDRRGYSMHWRDLADDGRYLIESTASPVAVAVDDNAFEIFVNQRVAALVRRIREDRPTERDSRVS